MRERGRAFGSSSSNGVWLTCLLCTALLFGFSAAGCSKYQQRKAAKAQAAAEAEYREELKKRRELKDAFRQRREIEQSTRQERFDESYGRELGEASEFVED